MNKYPLFYNIFLNTFFFHAILSEVISVRHPRAHMDLIPCPFSLGTSRADPNDIIPVDFKDLGLQKGKAIKFNIKGITYGNVSSEFKDRSFATVVYNKITKKVAIICNPPEFFAPIFDQEIIDEDPEQVHVDRSSLTIAFGSARRQKMLKEIDKTSERTNAVADAVVLQRAAHGQAELRTETTNAEEIDVKPVKGQLGPSSNSSSQQAQLLPPFNLKTKEVSQIYPIEKFVPSFCINALQKEAEDFAASDCDTQAKWKMNGTYPNFVLKRLAYLPIENATGVTVSGSKRSRKAIALGGQITRVQMATNLILLAHMFKLLKLKPRDLQSKLPLSNMPLIVSKYLLNEFTIMVGREGFERKKIRTMTPTLRDKLVYHIMILILHCDNFNTVIDDLAVDFKLPTERLKKFFIFVGCHFSKQAVITPNKDEAEATKQTTIARLIAPLVFKTTRAFKR